MPTKAPTSPPIKIEPEKRYRASEAAAYLGFPPGSFANGLREGRIALPHLKVGRAIRITGADLLSFEQAHTIRPGARQ